MEGSGRMAAVMIMAAMMPEDHMIDQAMEALQNYKLGIGEDKEPPMAEISMLMFKWQNAGKSPEEIVKQCQEVEEIAKFGSGIHDALTKDSN